MTMLNTKYEQKFQVKPAVRLGYSSTTWVWSSLCINTYLLRPELEMSKYVFMSEAVLKLSSGKCSIILGFSKKFQICTFKD